jgi:predicted dehydrogenase
MTLRIGLLGASRIAPRAVLEPAREREDVEVTAVAAREPERARAFAAEHGIDRVADDYAALVAREDVDLVYNALPPASHVEWTLAALDAGKAVLCEKPFAMDAAEAEVMAEAARRTGGLLMEAFHYRHHRVMHDAIACVRSGELGRVLRAEGVFEVPIPRTETELRWRAELGGGGLMDLGCYPLHAFRSLFGVEPTVTAASGRFEDGVDAVLRAELDFGGVPARLACSMVEPSPRAALTLDFEGGRMTIVNFIAPQIGCRFTVERDGVVEERPTDGPSTYAAQLEHVVQVWRGETKPLLGLDDAVANMRAIDAVYAAARESPLSPL